MGALGNRWSSRLDQTPPRPGRRTSVRARPTWLVLPSVISKSSFSSLVEPDDGSGRILLSALPGDWPFQTPLETEFGQNLLGIRPRHTAEIADMRCLPSQADRLADLPDGLPGCGGRFDHHAAGNIVGIGQGLADLIDRRELGAGRFENGQPFGLVALREDCFKRHADFRAARHVVLRRREVWASYGIAKDAPVAGLRSEEHTSELQSRPHL